MDVISWRLRNPMAYTKSNNWEQLSDHSYNCHSTSDSWVNNSNKSEHWDKQNVGLRTDDLTVDNPWQSVGSTTHKNCAYLWRVQRLVGASDSGHGLVLTLISRSVILASAWRSRRVTIPVSTEGGTEPKKDACTCRFQKGSYQCHLRWNWWGYGS